MTQIRIDTAEVESVSGQFQNKLGDMNQMVSHARGLMSNLQSTFQGQRANRVFNLWQEMQPNLQNALDTLQAASDVLRQAASDFSQADSI